MQRSTGSRLAVLSASAMLLVMLVPGMVLAQPHKAIFPMSLSVSVSGDAATVTVDVGRAAKLITSCTYAVDGGPAAACGSASSVGPKAARYSIALVSQPVGAHSVRVDIRTSKDGGNDIAAFTIPPPT